MKKCTEGGEDENRFRKRIKHFRAMDKPVIKYTQLFINNEFVDAVAGRRFETVDPSTEEVIALIAEADR